MYFFQDVHQREPAEEADLGVRGGPEPVAAAGRHLEGTHPTAHHRRALLRAPSQGTRQPCITAWVTYKAVAYMVNTGEVDGVNHHEINGEYFSSALSLLIHTRQVDISVGHREHLRVSLLSYSSRVSSANVHCINGLKERSPQNIFPTTLSFSKISRKGLAHTIHYTPSC